MGKLTPQFDAHLNGDQQRRPSVWWPTVWLAVVLLAVKASYVGPSNFWDWATPRDYLSFLYLQWVAAASRADLLFVLGAGLLAAAGLWIASRKRTVARFIARLFFIFGTVAVLYAVVAREFFAYAAAPLTFQLLSLGGRPGEMMSSLAAFLTPPVIVALVSAPVAYALLVWGCARIALRLPQRMRVLGRVIACGVLLGWFLLGYPLLGSDWFKAQDRYLPDSPHWVLLESTVLGFMGTRVNLGTVDIRPEDVCALVAPNGATVGGPGAAPLTEMTGSRPQNVILIVLESVGVEFLNLYGSKLETTPRLTGESNNSLVFDSYYAPVGWTAFSLFSIVHSRLPPLEGYDIASFSMGETGGVTLANVLSARGYRTAFMAAGDPDWASDMFFEGKGFTDILHMADVTGAKKLSSWGVRDGVLFDHMINWITAHEKEPFFLMGWSDQSHHPYRLAPDQPVLDLLPAEVQGHEDLARYVTLLHELDRQIGRLLDTLRTQGLADNTLVAITGDHGEAFGTLHRVSGHGFTVYDEEVRVPLVLWNPVLFAAAGRSARVGSHVDLNATLLDVLGIAPPAEWQGRSLLAQGAQAPVYLFAAGWGENLMGVRDGDWKYVFDARQGSDELYNLRTDPNEQVNVVAENQQLALRLRQKLAARVHVDKGDRQALEASCRKDIHQQLAGHQVHF